MSLEWWGAFALISFLFIVWLMWMDRPKKSDQTVTRTTVHGDLVQTRFINGCGAQHLDGLSPTHTCRCLYPLCDGENHVCLCGEAWSTTERKIP